MQVSSENCHLQKENTHNIVTALLVCLRTVDRWHEQTFDVTLEELGQDAIGSQLVKHAAEELLGNPCNIPWDQHTAIKGMTALDKQSHSTCVD